MADNKRIAEDILKAVGGPKNVTSATHCMTRLRLVLKDESSIDDDEVKAVDGVMGVVHGGQQYQIIVGTNVPRVYAEFCSLANVNELEAVEDAEAAAADVELVGKKKLTPMQILKNVVGYMAGCMTPMIPVLLTGGLANAINALCGPQLLGLYPAESDIYVLFDFIYDAALYFMPILAGVNAAKQFGINGMLGGFIGCILMSPDFAAIIAEGKAFTVFGIPCNTSAAYAQTVLPIMMSVPLFAVVYKFVGKHLPDVLSTVFTPILSLLVTSPFILCLLAPFGTIVGNAISGGLAWFGMNTGFFGVGVIAALWEFLVMSGMHLALMMPMMASFFETGEMTGVMLAGSFATWACFGVALGAALRLRGKAEGGNAFGAFVSGILGGVTEPVLYGICLSHVRCFGALMVGSFVGGAYAGIANLTQYVITSANFLSVLSYAGGTNANFIHGIIASLISLVVAAVCTYLFGFSKKELDQVNAK